MIRFSLQCSNEHDFEAWFRSNDDYERQKSDGHLTCAVCGSGDVSKALMAPNLGRKSNATPSEPLPKPVEPGGKPSGQVATTGTAPGPGAISPAMTMANAVLAGADPETARKVKQAMRELRAHVEANADYVGPKFANEARAIHHEEVEPRQIYGEASGEEVRDLLDEGIEVAPLPILPEDHN